MSTPDESANSADGFHSFHDEDGIPYGSFEVFWIRAKDFYGFHGNPPDVALDPGWYWWPCFGGYLPDGEPTGIFGTSLEALQDADEYAPERGAEKS